MRLNYVLFILILYFLGNMFEKWNWLFLLVKIIVFLLWLLVVFISVIEIDGLYFFLYVIELCILIWVYINI